MNEQTRIFKKIWFIILLFHLLKLNIFIDITFYYEINFMKKKFKKLTPLEKNALKDVQRVLIKNHKENLILLKLFGSKARGDSQLYSDFDLLAVVEKDSWGASEKMNDDVYDVIEKYNYELLFSLIVLEYDEFLLEQKIKTCFYQNIEREGLDLWKRS